MPDEEKSGDVAMVMRSLRSAAKPLKLMAIYIITSPKMSAEIQW